MQKIYIRYVQFLNRKFICLNDNIEHGKEEAKTVSTALIFEHGLEHKISICDIKNIACP